MPFNFYDTHTLLMAVQQLTPAATFLRDRYFPTNDASDIFATDDVLVEFRDGSKKLAPFVAPRKGGVTVLRAGYNMERYTPPFVAPRRVLTLDELRKRGFGEALYSQLTPEQRQQTLILRDADELGELITNREEAMAAETMLTNGCVMKHIADDVDKADEMEIRFYSEASNPATYTPTAKWDATGGKILKDLEAMIRMLTSVASAPPIWSAPRTWLTPSSTTRPCRSSSTTAASRSATRSPSCCLTALPSWPA